MNNKFTEDYITARRQEGSVFIRLTDVPREVLVNLAISKEYNLTIRLLEYLVPLREDLESILQNMDSSNIHSIKHSIDDAIGRFGDWDWRSGNVLREIKMLNDAQTMSELVRDCFKSEITRIEYTEIVLKSTKELPADYIPVIDKTISMMINSLDENSGVLNTDTLQIAFFDI